MLAGAVWMLDLGVFRVGHEEYANEDSPGDASFGLATLRREHAVARRDGGVDFRYIAKSGVPRQITLYDEHIHGLVSSLKRRRGGGEDLLAFRRGGRGGARAMTREKSSEIRAWAKAHGLPVSERGRIASSVVEQYEAAH